VISRCAIGVAAWRTSRRCGGGRAGGAQICGGRTRAGARAREVARVESHQGFEFDHAMGKLSESDFTEMGARTARPRAGLLRSSTPAPGYRDAIKLEIDSASGRRRWPDSRAGLVRPADEREPSDAGANL